MKTVSGNKVKTKSSRSGTSVTRKPRTKGRKSIESTDLNVDEDRTNADVAQNDNGNNDGTQQNNSAPVIDPRATDDTSVEAEQDREALRKMEDSHPDELLN